MKKSTQRDWATSLVAFIFIVISITGVLMYFHILDAYTKDMHEILGLAFVVAGILHVIVHFKSMKNYFSNRRFVISGAIIALIASVFIFTADSKPSIKGIVFDSIMDANVTTISTLFKVNQEQAIQRLKKQGINIENMNSIKAIAKANKTSPFRILDIIAQKEVQPKG